MITLKMRRTIYCCIVMMIMVLTACHNATVPKTFTKVDKAPKIYPDYTDVTVPVNIAPLTFEWDGNCDEIVARLRAGSAEVVCGGDAVQPTMSEWHELTAQGAGQAISVEVYTRNGDEWKGYRPFSIYVSKDSIDPYLSYRLISPSYVAYEELTLNQRCLENYDEEVMVDNMLCGTEIDGQCVNCHNYQQDNPERMQFHARQGHGGTVISYDGQLRKINMRHDSILSAGVYPTWHPWLPLIVYSTNKTSQSFHTRNLNKIEVFDDGSDLIAYDVEKNEVTNIENDSTEFEVFPYWAPDGKTVYYCSAHFEYLDTIEHSVEVIRRAKEIKYNIYKKSFDPETYTFGPRELVFAADSLGKSATLPRISPDGRYLMFTLGNYGVFHIWHHEADLWLLDLSRYEVRDTRYEDSVEADTSGVQGNLVPRTSHLAARNMVELNSQDTESYHSWSSNGRWVVFSSRRGDGGYTRPFIAHIDANGHGSKPFELPQADPDYHRQFMKSYNIPEFMKGRVEVTPQAFARVLKASDGEPVKYVSTLRAK